MTATSDTVASICLDMGTTNTRLWIVHNQAIVDRIAEPVGLRDAAREPNQPIVRDALAKFIATARSRSAALGLRADHVLAAGMLTSPLGLCEVPHLPAPAGEQELAKALHRFSDSKVADLPIYLVPGVRSGPQPPALEDLEHADLIRGEETIVVGLLRAGMLLPNSTFLNLGSHWKAIAIDENSRIASSFTTLSGELIHALQTQTVLASALPQGRFDVVDFPMAGPRQALSESQRREPHLVQRAPPRTDIPHWACAAFFFPPRRNHRIGFAQYGPRERAARTDFHQRLWRRPQSLAEHSRINRAQERTLGPRNRGAVLRPRLIPPF